MEGDGADERILALAEPYMCGGEQPVMHARVVREQVMRTLLSPPSAASAPALGQLIITNFALLFIVERSSTKRDVNDLWWNSLDIKVPLGAISRVEAKKDKFVRIHCKDFRILQFTMPYTLADPVNTKKQMELTMRKIESTLRMFAFSGKLKNLFAFSHTLSTKRCINGWERANVRKDLQRMGLPTDKWRISDSNHSYLICPTYPSVLGVPANVNDMTLHKVGGFRSKGRIPILSWIHPKNEATITRAAQPLVGIGGSRSTEDEHLIKEIIRATPSSALVIMDARPKVNAAANKARGAGYETMSHYAGEISGMSEDSIAVAEVEGLEGGIGQSGALEFLGIDNIHVMRDSEKKLKEICNHLSLQDKGWLTALDNSRWLDYISLLLACTRRMVLTIEAGISIFTHCSDGWDRTSQLSALAMLCLDPYYRTIEGFATLIEREWLAVGHKFQQRYGHGDKHHDDSNRSPIFPQFVDCVHQLLHQYPTCFEFNEDFLVTTLDALYSCQYGTFLCNSEKERQEAQLHSHTVSLWSYTDKHKDRFTSRTYIPYDQVLVPQSLAKHLKFWSLYFMRFCRFNEHNADRWCRDNMLVNGTHKQARASKKGKKAGKNSAATADGQTGDLLQHLAEREKWKKDLASREAEAKRMKQLAEKHMEQALRLKSRLTYERKRAAFFLERLDQATHQGSERLEHEWAAEWKKRREAGVTADDEDDDNYDLDDDDDDDEFDERHAKSSSERKKTKAEEEPDELVEFFIRSPSKRRLPVAAKSPAPAPAAAVVPPLPLNSSNDTSNPPPMPSPPSRRPPPPPGGAAVSSPPPSIPSSSSLSPLPSPVLSPSTRPPPPIRSPPYATNSLASGESTTSPMTFGVIRAFGQTTAPPSLSPRTAAPASLVSAASHAGDATRPALPPMPEGKLSLHRQMGKKLIPFLMRRPTREDLVARRILLPAEEDILMSLESRSSIDETGSSPYTSHRTDESEDDDASTPGATPPSTPPALIDEMDDLAETDRDFLLRAASAASGTRRVPSSYTSAASSGSGHRTDPPPVPSPSSSGPNFSSGSSWLSSASQPPRSKITSSANVPFTPAHHRSGNGSLGSASSGTQPPSAATAPAAATAVSPPEPKRGLIQRFVSEKDVGASSVRKPGSRP